MNTLKLMYDSISPGTIPPNAAIVGGYADGHWAWPARAWSRFPDAKRVSIFTSADHDLDPGIAVDVFCLDVERGDATPDEAPAWVEKQRGLGREGRIWTYTSVSNWPFVRQAFKSQGIAESWYWIAWYNNNGCLDDVVGARAKQFIGSNSGFDLSVTDFF